MSLINPRLYQMPHGIFYMEFARGVRISLKTHNYDEAVNKYKELRAKFVMELAQKIIESPVEVKNFINKPKNNKHGYIYFLQSGNDGLIKIGFSNTNNFNNRIKTLQSSTAHEINLLKIISGTIQKEKLLHKKFAQYRCHGEWFKPEPELLNYINSPT